MLEDNIDGKGGDTKFYKNTMKLFDKAFKYYNLLKMSNILYFPCNMVMQTTSYILVQLMSLEIPSYK